MTEVLRECCLRAGVRAGDLDGAAVILASALRGWPLLAAAAQPDDEP